MNKMKQQCRIMRYVCPLAKKKCVFQIKYYMSRKWKKIPVEIYSATRYYKISKTCNMHQNCIDNAIKK